MASMYTAHAVHVIIISTGSPVSNFTKLHALTLAAYALFVSV